jgi:hypothetical protein
MYAANLDRITRNYFQVEKNEKLMIVRVFLILDSSVSDFLITQVSGKRQPELFSLTSSSPLIRCSPA